MRLPLPPISNSAVATRRPVLSIVLTALWLVAMGGEWITAQEPVVVLRDLTVQQVTPEGWTESGLRISNEQILGWDLIASIQADGSEHEALLAAFRDRGPLLYRLRHRLEIEDDGWLLQIAESEFERIADRLSTPATARSDWIVLTAVFRGAIHEGRRTLAAEAFVRMAWMRANLQLPRDVLRLREIESTAYQRGWDDALCPWFFDAAGAVRAIERLPRRILHDVPATWLYFGGWARAAGDETLIRESLAKIREQQLTATWHWLMQWELRLQRELESMDRFRAEWLRRSTDPATPDRAYARQVGRLVMLDSQPAVRDAERRVLDYLTIVANAGDLDREIPAAALYRAAEAARSLKGKREFETLRRELIERYANTYHARIMAVRLEKPDERTDDGTTGRSPSAQAGAPPSD